MATGNAGAVDPVSDLMNTDTSARMRAGNFTTFIEAKLCYVEAYDSLFGHNSGNSLASMPEQEKFVAGSYMEHRAYEYAKFRIYELFHLSWLDWISLPRFVMASLKRVAEKFSKDDLAAAEAAKRAAEAAKNQR